MRKAELGLRLGEDRRTEREAWEEGGKSERPAMVLVWASTGEWVLTERDGGGTRASDRRAGSERVGPAGVWRR